MNLLPIGSTGMVYLPTWKNIKHQPNVGKHIPYIDPMATITKSEQTNNYWNKPKRISSHHLAPTLLNLCPKWSQSNDPLNAPVDPSGAQRRRRPCPDVVDLQGFPAVQTLSCILGECYIIAKLKEIILYKLRLYGAANQSAWFLFKMLFRAHNMHGWSGRVFMCYETL